MHPSLIAAGIGGIGDIAVAREAMRTKPAKYSAGEAAEALYGGYEDRVNQQGSGRKPAEIELATRIPDDTLRGKYDAYANTGNYLSSGKLENGDYRITMNPNASREMLAHELGHVAAQQSDLGSFIANTRHSPALRNSIAKAALMTIPAGAVAALLPGDQDLDESTALAALIAAPEILDEINATRHGLGIMKNAGMPATAGQRGRLAGGLLSYMAAPIAMGGIANFVRTL